MALEFDLEKDRGPAVGLIELQTDTLVDPELGGLFLGLGIRPYFTRIPAMPEVRTDTLNLMAATMTDTAAMLPPDVGIRAIAYACTSGATILGEARVAELIRAAHPGVEVSNPLSALKAACRALGIRTLGLVSPYVAEVSDALRASLAADGVEVTAYGSFEQAEDRTVGQISPASTLRAVLEIGAGDCDAVFASCTNLRALEIVPEAEAKLDKPVLCSNQVLAWHMLRLAGIEARPDGYGRLFQLPLRG